MSQPFNPRLMIFFVLLVGIMAPIPVDEYAPSMPAMVKFFGSGVSAIQLSITAFLLALGIGQVIMGPLSDHYGRRVVLISGIAIFLVGTLACIFAEAVWLLMIGRAIQGLGIASCAPTFLVMVGIGLSFPNYYGIAVGVFTSKLTGVANALIGTLVLFGTVLYTVVLTAFHAHAPTTLAGVYLALSLLSLGSYRIVARLKTDTAETAYTKSR